MSLTRSVQILALSPCDEEEGMSLDFLADDDQDELTTEGDDLEKHRKKHRHRKHKKHKKHHKKHHQKSRRHYTVNGTSIWDAPRFAHRGLLVDTARHFLPVSVIMVTHSHFVCASAHQSVSSKTCQKTAA